jgi:hypothetical protein
MANTARLYPLGTMTNPYPLRKVKPRARLVPDARFAVRTSTFSPLEEDFFARAADLYPQPSDEVEEWDQLFAAVKVGL